VYASPQALPTTTQTLGTRCLAKASGAGVFPRLTKPNFARHTRIGEIMPSLALFLLCQMPDYAKYATPGWQYLFDRQAMIENPTLNVLAIVLLSFRVSHEGH
jgi:hypothetical protein